MVMCVYVLIEKCFMRQTNLLSFILCMMLFKSVCADSVFDSLTNQQLQKQDNPFELLHQTDQEKNTVQCSGAKIVALNKIVASRQILDLQLNKPIFFHNLEINLVKCVKNLDPYKGDSFGFFILTEHKVNDDAKIIFHGWLISSSQSISTFENPVYEIFLQNCS